jgi:hypothetical protein
LLHVEVRLVAVRIVVQVLLRATHFLLVQRRIDPDLVREHRFVFTVLDVGHLH